MNTDMTDDELRIKVAELCGWSRETRKMYGGEKNVKGWGTNRHLGLGDRERDFTTSPYRFPDYCNDLNAMHEAEKSRGWHTDPENTEADRYFKNLLDVCCEYPGTPTYCATARQRALAFIQTMNAQAEPLAPRKAPERHNVAGKP